jgi:hypothetical protein
LKKKVIINRRAQNPAVQRIMAELVPKFAATVRPALARRVSKLLPADNPGTAIELELLEGVWIEGCRGMVLTVNGRAAVWVGFGVPRRTRHGYEVRVHWEPIGG